MTVSRKLGTLVLMGVPAIIGGGIVYYFTQSFPVMWLYEVILGFTFLGLIAK